MSPDTDGLSIDPLLSRATAKISDGRHGGEQESKQQRTGHCDHPERVDASIIAR